MFRITIRRLLVLMTLVGFLLSIFVTKSHLRAVAFFISNDDVVYEAEAKSIRLTGATRLLCLFCHQSWPVFSRCLDDPDKYVAAHFALSRLVDRHGGELGLRGHDRFTHMRMKGTIVESSTLRIDPESHQVVRQMWSQYLNRLSQQGRDGGVYYLHLFDLDEIEELCAEGDKELDSEEAKNEFSTPD